jgi:pimeloyl-ACP methyl ester carboxylesterase
VLLCQPWGLEYQCAHRTIRLLATRLARRGWHALRFDYTGTGDSSGDTTEADLGTWHEDVTRAAEELHAIGGSGPLGLVGLRLGGTLAAQAAGGIDGLESLVLWDPIVRGQEWLHELDAIAPPQSGLASPLCELGGHTVTRGFREQIARLDALPVGPLATRSLWLWTTGDDPADPAPMPVDGLTEEKLSQPSPWLEDVSLGRGQIPVGAVTCIVEWLG